MHILSFYEQDKIFNEIYSKEIDNLLLNGEESLRGTEATTEQFSIEDYFLAVKWHITSSQKIDDARIEIIKQSLSGLYALYFKKIYPDLVNVYSLRIIDIYSTSPNTIELVIVIDSSEARLRNII
ncbi:hypothetical protein HMPREF9189_0078 [Streptococcus sp. oral taxon 071 str. 73H25AP]|uniref:hypothetical protein n=1 Tax=Streptococcus sp. oral taxon 071 TaxID=712630 RepID=UPI0001E0FF8F|nr:hypothetical protein [Streptococcus sp. oral taxon 071]EFM36266.1 hypothetical protein HMPREF9189_0078 [Streptococcus sp. oral taxon 071 str. 73H25AP]